MKNTHLICILFSLFLSLQSCKKDNNSDSSSAPNIVTLTIDGKQYKATGNKWGSGNYDRVETAITKYSDGTADFYLYIFTMGGGNSDFVMLLNTNKGPGNGLGTFQIPTNGHNSISENFSGGEGYNITGGNVTITKSSPNLIEGTITMILSNPNRTKTVTGSFKIGEPIY
jgi:hypothetical protein